jgi:anti-repressor protein
MNELVKVDERFNENSEQLEQVVSARSVWKLLEVTEKFALWFAKRCDRFLVGDNLFTPTKQTVTRGDHGAVQEIDDYFIPVDIAKMFAAAGTTKKSTEFIKYLIEVEKAWNDPDKIMIRALQVANHRLELKDKKIKEQAKELEQAQPAIDFVESVKVSHNSMDFRAYSIWLHDKDKGFKVGRDNLMKLLRPEGFLGQDNLPYYRYISQGIFEVASVECNDGVIREQTFVTSKGQSYLFGKLKLHRIRKEKNNGKR